MKVCPECANYGGLHALEPIAFPIFADSDGGITYTGEAPLHPYPGKDGKPVWKFEVPETTTRPPTAIICISCGWIGAPGKLAQYPGPAT